MYQIVNLNSSEETVTFELNRNKFSFNLDKKLCDLIVQYADEIVAVYQYAVTISDSLSGEIIIKRSQLSDINTIPYNPFLLEAHGGQLQILPICGIGDWQKIQLKKSDEILSEVEIDDSIHSRRRSVGMYTLYDTLPK